MNSAVFIRRKSVLALWVLTPLVVMSGMFILSLAVLGRQNEVLHQDRTLALLIPEMTEALDEFDRFAADYRLDAVSSKLPLEDHHIILFNAAAEKTKFVITAINLAQNDVAKTQTGITQIALMVKGSGTTAQIASFLNYIKVQDHLIYENQVQITPDRSRPGTMLMEAEFGRVYLNTENHNATSI